MEDIIDKRRRETVEHFLSRIREEIYNLTPVDDYLETLRNDLYEYQENNPECTEEDLESEFGTPEEIAKDFLEGNSAIQPKQIAKGKVFHQCGSVTTTIRVLGYPTRRALYTWIANEGTVKSERKPLKLMNTAEHPRNPPVEVKMEAIHRCFELGESIKSVSEAIGYTRASIYSWRKKYLHGGIPALINDKNI